MLGREFEFDLGAGVIGNLGQSAPVEDSDGRNRTHDGNLSTGPGQHAGGTERLAIHRDVGATVCLAGDQGDARNFTFGKGVQQLRAATHHAVPLLTDAGKIPGHVDNHDQRDGEGVTHPHEACGLFCAR